MTDDTDTDTERIERTDIGASAEVSITRGTGTRDQEKWKLKGKGDDASQALQELKRELAAVVGPLNGAEPMADQVRDFQPGDSDD